MFKMFIMAGLYDYNMIKLMSKDITDGIGAEKIYTNKPTSAYPNAPQNFRLDEVDIVFEFVLDRLRRTSGLDIQLYVIQDKFLRPDMYGLFVKQGLRNYILLNPSLNSCWQRFAMLKELCSLYIDHYDKDSKLTRYDNYLESLVNAFEQKKKLVANEKLDEGDFDSETFSILLATELLIASAKQMPSNLFVEFETTKITLNDLAKSLMMPEFVLKLYYEKKWYLQPAPAIFTV